MGTKSEPRTGRPSRLNPPCPSAAGPPLTPARLEFAPRCGSLRVLQPNEHPSVSGRARRRRWRSPSRSRAGGGERSPRPAGRTPPARPAPAPSAAAKVAVRARRELPAGGAQRTLLAVPAPLRAPSSPASRPREPGARATPPESGRRALSPPASPRGASARVPGSSSLARPCRGSRYGATPGTQTAPSPRWPRGSPVVQPPPT